MKLTVQFEKRIGLIFFLIAFLTFTNFGIKESFKTLDKTVVKVPSFIMGMVCNSIFYFK